MRARSAPSPRPWTRATLQREEWLRPFPRRCLDELDKTAQILKRNPLHTYLLDPRDYPLEQTRGFMAEAKAVLDSGCGFVVLDRLPVRELGRERAKDLYAKRLATAEEAERSPRIMIGLTVQHIATPQTLSAAFERDSKERLRLKGCLKQVPYPGPLPEGEGEKTYWFRTVTGTTPDGRRTLVIWRRLTATRRRTTSFSTNGSPGRATPARTASST